MIRRTRYLLLIRGKEINIIWISENHSPCILLYTSLVKANGNCRTDFRPSKSPRSRSETDRYKYRAGECRKRILGTSFLLAGIYNCPWVARIFVPAYIRLLDACPLWCDPWWPRTAPKHNEKHAIAYLEHIFGAIWNHS
jgi:hypothetical protein